MKILDADIDIEAGKYLLFKRHWLLLILVTGTALMDAVSTMYFMLQTGPGPEMNWVVRMLSFGYGPIVGPLLGKLYQIFAVWVISVIVPRLTRFVCLMVITFNVYAFFVNFHM
ncbi:MAG: hypothetical protein K9N55_03155 [Phycisphaerae bacterium]|nr:hypothetical protein [Phycisphaerae bacterium]